MSQNVLISRRSSSFSSKSSVHAKQGGDTDTNTQTNSRGRSSSISNRINQFNELSRNGVQFSNSSKPNGIYPTSIPSKSVPNQLNSAPKGNSKEKSPDRINGEQPAISKKPALPSAPKPKVIPPRPKGLLPTDVRGRAIMNEEIDKEEKSIEDFDMKYKEDSQVIDGYTLKVHIKTNTLDIIKTIVVPVDMTVLKLKQFIASKCNIETEPIYLTNQYNYSSIQSNNSVIFPQMNINSDIQKEILLSRYMLRYVQKKMQII